MLFAIKDELNATDGYDRFEQFKSGQQEPWINLNFVQAKLVKGGIIISFGYDPDFPNKTVTAIKRLGQKAVFRKAERHE